MQNGEDGVRQTRPYIIVQLDPIKMLLTGSIGETCIRSFRQILLTGDFEKV